MMKTPYYFLFLISSLFFQISVSFAQNENPVAVDDDLIVHSWGTYTVNVLDNDYDPDGDSIYIDEVYDEEGFEISFSSSQVFITVTSHYLYAQRIKYRIKDIHGKTDKAYISVSYEEHADAVHPIADTIFVENQVPIELNLIENDIYLGNENLKLTSVSTFYGGNIEILPDSQSVRYVSNPYNGPSSFSYVVEEAGGHHYVSFGSGFIFVSKNEDAPIVRADTFEVQAGQVSFLDVLSNDTPQENIDIHSITGNEFLSIENSKIKIDLPENYPSRISFRYDIVNTENGLQSMPGKVIVDIQPMVDIPVAVIDTVEYVYTIDDVEVFPLGNDINPSGNGLVIHETGTESLFVNFSNKTGWFDKSYQAKDTVSGLISKLSKIYIHVLPPDSIQVQDEYIDYTMGDVIEINPYEGTNLPDSIHYTIDTEIGKYVWYNNTYSFDVNKFDGLINNEWNHNYDYELSDRIEIIFNVIDGNQSIKVMKYIYVNYVSPSFYSTLGINNVDLTISPNGFHYGNIKYPNQSYTQPIYILEPWMADYTNQEIKRVSGNASVYDGADFVSGPLADDYSAEYQEKYYRTWKVSKEEIQYHMSNWSNSVYQIPESILSWPSQQTIYNGVSYEGAEYIDVNENGFYDPENGDYPKIRGDEAVLYIVNDGRYRNGEYGPPLDSLCVDIYTLVYAFNRPDSEYFNNTFFIKYKVVNKSSINYEDFKLGLYAKNKYGNIGSSERNKLFIACDTQLNTFYSYPGLNIAPSESYWPNKPPITLFSILNQNLDKFTEVVTGHSMWPDNYSANKRYHYLNGTWDENLNHPYPCWSLNAPIDYVYPDHPLDFGADNSLSNQNICYSDSDAQMLGVSGSHILSSGESMTFEYAIQFYYHPESGYGESIDGALNSVADLLECYQNDSVPGGGSFTGINEQMEKTAAEVSIYPNPARTTLYIQTENKDFETYRIYSLHGQLLEESNYNIEISIQHLPPGFYFLQLMGKNGKMELTRKFVKQ
ncbi:Ig-like domain-containing protein [Lentimicrobium sp. S6]|uniref:Ig-like domain-containing protein n=1 Tax=Lentimicrobium sp. S6 TaxID=2735872 RepID=UPI0015533D11|nr:Ig-like domain-containing protein [Lentimicrobium sp. S6]NPD46846.1 T9SS type A sorting domain-containing protein [Lentimicrobium sp. S6]